MNSYAIMFGVMGEKRLQLYFFFPNRYFFLRKRRGIRYYSAKFAGGGGPFFSLSQAKTLSVS